VKLDPVRFERFVWSTSDVHDAVTSEIAARVDRFIAGESTVAAIAADVRAASLDVLVFLDAGLDPRNNALASLRLAPVQAAFYGHPVTTGLESVDYFVSGELLETAASDSHYREKLVRLPGIGASVQPPPAPGDGTWIDKLRPPGKAIVICLQNLGKVPPSFDATLARILANSGARLVFLNRGERLTQRFRARIDGALEAHRVPRDAIHIEPTRDRGEFLGGIARADLVLDTPGFSGGATSLDALSTGTPIVTFEGESARARQTSAMLRMLGLQELIAVGDASYIALATALLGDPAKRDEHRQRIRANAPSLFGDARTIDALQNFLTTAASR
jgi:predicted O-linked N-acetylglucosamine transferase (SPINDLY family)